jgi:hypothetical protein
MALVGEPSTTVPEVEGVAAELLVRRIAPAVDPGDASALIAPLLNHLPPDARLVIIRVHGLDGRPNTGVREVAKELRMSRDRVQALVAIGEKQLREALVILDARRRRRTEAVADRYPVPMHPDG